MNTIPSNGIAAVLAGVCSVSYLYFGIYIFSPSLKDARLRPLFYGCIFSFAWCLCFVMYYLSVDPSAKELWQRFTFSGMMVCVFTLWFLMRYTGLIKNKRAAAFISIAIWLPPLAAGYKSIAENAVLRDFPSGFWFLYTEIQTFMYNLASICFVLVFYFRNKTNKRRRQAYILCGSGIVMMVSSWAADYFFGFHKSQNLIPFWVLVWIGFVLYTIKKYRLITITPDFISRDITENIEEGIILLDTQMNVIFTNGAMRRLVNAEDAAPIILHDIVYETHVLDGELSKLVQTDGDSFTRRFSFIMRGQTNKIPVDVKVKKVIDSYNDITGFLMIVSRVKDIGQLKTLFRITSRELEVIRQLEMGMTKKEIAGFLKIRERTIDTHIANIYNKLGVNNRIEFINLISGYETSIENAKRPA